MSADLWQLTANGVLRGSLYAALGAGLALVLGVTARFHFAYALTYTIAPYVAFLVLDRVGLPFGMAVALGLVAAIWTLWTYYQADRHRRHARVAEPDDTDGSGPSIDEPDDPRGDEAA